MELRIMMKSRVSRILIDRHEHLVTVNSEEDPHARQDTKAYWKGRRHELEFIMEELGIPVPK